MAVVKYKPKGKKNFRTIKKFGKYEKAWGFVASKLIDMDCALYYSQSLQYLGDGYTKRRVFPFGTNVISRKGNTFKIIP